MSVSAGTPRSITRSITIPNQTSGLLHYVFVRAHDGAGNWGAWTQLALTVTNAFGPLALPENLGPVAGLAPVAAPLASPGRSAARAISVQGNRSGATGLGRLRRAGRCGHASSSRRTASASTARRRSCAVATPPGTLVLSVEARGNAQHGYRLRAVSGAKHSDWLQLRNHRVVLEAALRLGKRPTLYRAH